MRRRATPARAARRARQAQPSPARENSRLSPHSSSTTHANATEHLHNTLRHCEPTGRREAPPDDRLREAIHVAARGQMDCFVAVFLAMTEDISLHQYAFSLLVISAI